MITTRLALTILAVAVSCAGSIVPFAWELAVLNRITALAKSEASARSTALQTLQQIALGRTLTVDTADLEGRVGAKSGELTGAAYRDNYVRVHAMRCIGKVGGEQAVDFLENLTLVDLGPDEGNQVWHQVWPAARIALHEARMNQIADHQGRIEFLESILSEQHDAISNSQLAHWAVEELCNGGIPPSLPAVAKSIRGRDSSERGEQDIRYCEARMRVVMSDPDQVAALGSVLRVSNRPIDGRVIQWALNQLTAMRSARADEMLERYAAEIRNLPENSAQRQELRSYEGQIRHHRMHRSNENPVK
jgi:hypothetical protein